RRAVRAGVRGPARGALPQRAQDHDLRRQQRDPAQHHRAAGARSLAMDFRLTEEQQLLRDSIARFVANEYTFEARKKIVASPKGWSDAVWRQFAEMGLLGAPFAAGYGGFGGTSVDVMVVQQELGRGLVVEPYLSTVVLGGGLVELAGTEEQKQAILP